MSENSFNFNKFISDSKETLINPKGYFEKMPLAGGFGEPIIKALLYGLVAAIINLIWGFVFVGSLTGGMLGGLAGIGGFFVTIIGAIIGLFIGALIVLIISLICNGSSDFEPSLRVTASLMVLFPIMSLLKGFNFINYYLGSIISFAVNIYMLYLLYLAVIGVLKGKDGTAKILSYVFAGIFFIVLIGGFFTHRAVNRLAMFGNEYKESLSKIQGELEKASTEFAQDEATEGEKQVADDEEDMFSDADAKRPDEFPEKAIVEVKSYFSTGPNMITDEKITKLINALDASAEYKDNPEKFSEILKVNGYDDVTEFTQDVIAVVSGVMAVGSLSGLEKIINAPKEEKESAKMFTMDQAFKSTAIQSIQAAKLTEQDLRVIYDNWDDVKEIQKKGTKSE